MRLSSEKKLPTVIVGLFPLKGKAPTKNANVSTSLNLVIVIRLRRCLGFLYDDENVLLNNFEQKPEELAANETGFLITENGHIKKYHLDDDQLALLNPLLFKKRRSGSFYIHFFLFIPF